MGAKLTPEHYKAVAERRGLTWAGDMPERTILKTTWVCSNGHAFDAAYNNIQAGKGCPTCKFERLANSRKLPPSAYADIALKYNLQWVGEMPLTTFHKTTWVCAEGHTFQSRYSDIRSGCGCPICANKARSEHFRHKPEDYHALASAIGYRWLGDLPPSVNDKTAWQCPQGHIFEMWYANLKTGQRCPTCKPTRLRQHFQHKADAYHILAQTRGFQWVGTELPNNTKGVTDWICDNGHGFSATYISMAHGNNCPHCSHMVNGKLVSKPQLALHALSGGELNYQVGRYFVDIALEPTSIFRIAIEYDCYYWHDVEHDKKRDAFLHSRGWRILRIKSGVLIPSLPELQTAIERLRSGETYLEITMPDWKSPA